MSALVLKIHHFAPFILGEVEHSCHHPHKRLECNMFIELHYMGMHRLRQYLGLLGSHQVLIHDVAQIQELFFKLQVLALQA